MHKKQPGKGTQDVLEVPKAELQRALEDARQAAAKYNRLFDFAPVAYFVLDPAGIIHEVNFAGAALLGSERKCVDNQRFEQYVAPESRTVFQSFYHDVWSRDEICVCSIWLRRQDPGPRYVSIESTVATGGADKNRRCLLTVQDLTVRKQIEEEIRRHSDELRDKSEELARFNRVLVDRELRMIELKKEVNDFCAQMGQKKRYPLDFEPKGA